MISWSPIVWSSENYGLEARRSLLAGGRHSLVLHIKQAYADISLEPGLKVSLPRHSARHMVATHAKINDWADCFANEDEWRAFQAQLCDDYCEFYVFGQIREGNLFHGVGAFDPTGMRQWLALHAAAKEYSSFKVPPAKNA